MAKPPMMVHVQSSDFKKLLEVQQLSLEHVQTIRTLVESGSTAKREDDILRVQKKQLEQQEELVEVSKVSAEELKRIKSEEAEAISNIASTVKTFDSIRDKVGNIFKGFKDKFGSVRATGTTALKAINVGGFLDKKIAERQFVDQQRKLGSEKTDKELREDFKTRNKVSKDIKSNEAEIEKFKKETGLGDKDLSKTKEGQRLLEKRESLTDTFRKTDLRANLIAKPEPAGTEKTNKEQNDAVNVSEEEMEATRREEAQTKLLEEISKNTSALGGDKAKAAAPSSGDGGGFGILGALGAGFKALGAGLKFIGAGAGAGIRALLIGIAQGVRVLANPQSLLGLGAATLAFMGIGKALEFAAPFMEAFAPVLIKIADVIQNVFVAAIEAFAPVLIKVVDVIQNVFVAAIQGIPNVIKAVGDVVMGVVGAISDAITKTIDAVTTSIERLAKIDGMNLLKVGAGLVAISGGMATFAAANVAGGLSNLVSGFLSFISGQKNPVDQILALGAAGANIEKAGIGIEKLGGGLKVFSDIKPETIKAIAALPVEKIAAMGAAMGQANFVSNQSAANDGARAAAASGRASAGANVIAPVTNNNTTRNQIVQLPVRNQEQTMNRYIKTRFAS